MITRLLVFATGALLLGTMLAFGGRWFWACELLVNFRTHFAMGLGFALIVAAVTRRWAIAGLAALGFALNAWFLQGAFIEPRTEAIADTHAVRLVSFNVHVGNSDAARIAAYLDSLSPDVVVLEEVTPANAERLESLLTKLPHRHAGMRGVVVFSRWPLIPTSRAAPDEGLLQAPVEVDLGDRRLRLHALHLHWPLMPEAATVRNAQLRLLGRELAACEGACVAVGDFNTTPWSSHFRGVLSVSGFRDCAAGRGLLPTWPSGLPAFLRIRIDLCLASAAVSVADVRVGANVGSDHLATINDLLVGGARK